LGSKETHVLEEDSAPDKGIRIRAIMALVMVNFLWGFSFPLIKVLNLEIQDHFEPGASAASNGLLISGSAWIIAIRFAVAMGLLLVVCRRLVRTVRWPHVLAGGAIGTLFFAGLFLQVAGLATIPASRSGFLTSLVVVWTPIFATLFERQIPRRLTIVGAAVSIVGVSILTGMIRLELNDFGIASDALSKWQVGDSLTSIAVLFFALQIILVDYFGKRYESTAFTPSMFASTMVWGFVVFGALQLTSVPTTELPIDEPLNGTFNGWMDLTLQARFWIPSVLLSVFSTLLAFLLMNRYQPVLTAGQAAVIYTLEPLFASIWAMFLPGWMMVFCAVVYANETLTWNLVVGGTLLIFANGIALWPTKQKRYRRNESD
jgi:drug/metabolite transporter (DMT)-like permease